ncbi:hypothetical protein C8R44DRAFT_756347 [Mycena epipterygia]|nr:hypothetical protein C8R44DRAFT_756347 [Mycena epipterygia]
MRALFVFLHLSTPTSTCKFQTRPLWLHPGTSLQCCRAPFTRVWAVAAITLAHLSIILDEGRVLCCFILSALPVALRPSVATRFSGNMNIARACHCQCLHSPLRLGAP